MHHTVTVPPRDETEIRQLVSFYNPSVSLSVSHLLSDLGFLLQGEGHQFVSDAVLLVAVGVRHLEAEQDRKQLMIHMIHYTCDSQTKVQDPTEVQ